MKTVKIQDLSFDQIDDKGDCYGICLIKLFEFYKKTGIEGVFQYGYKITFNEELSNNGIYNISNNIDIEIPNYLNLIDTFFNIKSQINKASFDNIKNYINSNMPIVIFTQMNMLPWSGVSAPGEHFILIAGYDIENSSYICVDSYLTNSLVNLPFEIIEQNELSIANFEFGNFNCNNFFCKNNILNDEISYLINSMKDSPASKTMKDIYMAIKNNSRYITKDNFHQYFNSPKDAVFMSIRFARLCGLYEYLFNKYNQTWLYDISKLYQNAYRSSRNKIFLELKYLETNDKKTLNKLINVIYSYVLAESEVESIFHKNI